MNDSNQDCVPTVAIKFTDNAFLSVIRLVKMSQTFRYKWRYLKEGGTRSKCEYINNPTAMLINTRMTDITKGK